MEKLIKSHADYYTYANCDMYFKIVRKQSGTIMLMNDEFDCCVICDRHFNVLHEVIIGGGGAFPSMAYRS